MKTANDSARVASFGIFQLNTQIKELVKSGRTIKLNGQPIEILMALVERPGELIPRSELQARLWPENTYVDFEHGLNKAISKIRMALNDSADNPRFLQTIQGEGYRFIAPVVWITPQAGAGQLLQLKSPETAATAFQRPILWLAVAGALLLLACGAAGYYLYGRSFASMSEVKLTARAPGFPIEAECISPDGKYIAFADHDGLWLQVVESREMHQLEAPGMSAVTRISWLPDSTGILVSATAQAQTISSVWNVSIFGGAPRKLRDDAGQAIPSDDGSRIAFTSGDAKEVWTISSTGESAQKIATATEGDQFGGLLWAGSGSALIAERIHESNGDFNIFLELRDLSSAKTTTFLAEPGLRSFCGTPDGTIIYSRSDPAKNTSETHLWKLRVDPQSGEVLESPRQITHWPGYSLAGLSVTHDGKHLAAEKGSTHLASYAVRLDMAEKSPASLTPLTFHERDDFPGSWDPASHTVFLNSNRDGRWEIFKQDLAKHVSEYVVGSMQNAEYPVLTPDGHSILYQTMPTSDTTGDTPVNLLRVSASGGPPQVLWQGRGFYRVQCANSPATRCVLCRPAADGRHLMVAEFDPEKGIAKDIGSVATTTSAPRLYLAWALSPDGSQIVLTEPGDAGTRLRVFSLANLAERDVLVAGWRGFRTISWAADARSFFLLMASENGSTILKVDAEGRARVLREINHRIFSACVPSPDGRWLAFAEVESNTNVVLLTGF